MNPIPTLTDEARRELEAFEDRRLEPHEFEARVNAPWTEHEREDFDSLVRWFTNRYATPAARLAAARSLHAQWARNRPR